MTVPTSVVSDDPHTLVSLSRVAALLNEFFDGEDIGQDTPFVWWDRSKRNKHISHPMPEPIGYAGQDGATSPIWHQEQVLHWYGQWRGLVVPEGRPAGDRLDSRGRFYPSPHRA